MEIWYKYETDEMWRVHTIRVLGPTTKENIERITEKLQIR